ncbi:hypothetical protein F3Y22_tig00111758pilonHSYRG00343 [Hibiscus syriacus]|uniref:C2 tensin-type domain-containing protein n=1 Tax=Hibiscus syriacus TaxID=106335 RepID=A0A6A2XWK4_HIBSY|nr:hypothetical protein F3Y22_tig00111758pilonHSYRG00343 [Hibiscus syriacus]
MTELLSEYDMKIMDYPCHYEGCPLITMEVLNLFMRSCESWLSLDQNNFTNALRAGGWPVMAFVLAALLLYRKHYSGEHKTLDIYTGKLRMKWPPLDQALTLGCIILRHIPNIDGEGGCRPIFRIHGQDPSLAADKTPNCYTQALKVATVSKECALAKIDINCHVQGDVVVECVNLNDKEGEKIFRTVFNTAFIRSNILIFSRDELDNCGMLRSTFPKNLDLRSYLVGEDSFLRNGYATYNMLQQIGALNISQENSDSDSNNSVDNPQRGRTSPRTLLEEKLLAALPSSPMSRTTMALKTLVVPSNKSPISKEAKPQDSQIEPFNQSALLHSFTCDISLTPFGKEDHATRQTPPIKSPPPKIPTAKEDLTVKVTTPATPPPKTPPVKENQIISGMPPEMSQFLKDALAELMTTPVPIPPTMPPLRKCNFHTALPALSLPPIHSIQEVTSAPPPPRAPTVSSSAPTPPPQQALIISLSTAPRPPQAPTVSSSAPPTPPPPTVHHLHPLPPPTVSSSAPTPPHYQPQCSSSALPPPPSIVHCLHPTTTTPNCYIICIPTTITNYIISTSPTTPTHNWSLTTPSPPPPPTTTGSSTTPSPPATPCSFWAPEIDISELENLFSAAAPKTNRSKSSSRAAKGPKTEKVQLLIAVENTKHFNAPIGKLVQISNDRYSYMNWKLGMIDLRLAYNCEIMLSKVKVSLPELMDTKGTAVTTSVGDSNNFIIKNLSSVLALEESALDVDQGYTGDKDKLGKCELHHMDQYVSGTSETVLLGANESPRVESSLGYSLSRFSFAPRGSLNIVNSIVEEANQKFCQIEEINADNLSLGNALNQGTAREEMQAVSKGLEEVVQELSSSENDGPVSQNFREGRNVDALIIYSEIQLNVPLNKIYFQLALIITSTLLNFVRLFNKAHDENCKQLEQEMKKAENEKLQGNPL